MLKAIPAILAITLALLLTGCAAQTYSSSTTTPDEPSNRATETPVVSEAPSPTPSLTPIPTTAPDITPTVKPEPSPSPSPSKLPAGLVKNSGEIIGSSVAFRKEPNKDSQVIGRLGKGTFVQIVKTNVNAQWHQVSYNGKTGYVSRMYVCLDSSLDGYKLDFVGTIINCNKDVNIRREPNTKSKIVGVAKKGSNLNIIPYDNYIEGWYKVEHESKAAYIHADYVDVGVKVDDNQLSSLSVTGGSLFPSFSPNEYGYVVKAAGSKVTIKAKANSGVKISINGTGKSKYTVEIPSAGMKTVRIALDGKIRYSLYISRNVLTVGTWNIKRGNKKLLMQGRLIYDQQPDIMGIQEAYQNLKADDIIDNLASLRTKDMSHTLLSPTINYSKGGKYGNGLMSRYKLKNVQTFKLDSGKYEKRLLQKAVVTIAGKTVSVYNTHFTYNTAAVRKKQFAEVLKIMDADKNKYKILMGDFNASITEFSVFKNYTVINTKETKYYDYSKSDIDYNEIDNIVVSKNIKVVNTRIIKTKYSDHYPVFAYLILN